MPRLPAFFVSPTLNRDVRKLARQRRASIAETTRRALNTELLLAEEVEAGGRVVVQAADGTTKQIVIRR
jgi:hypothetical protein